MSAICHLQLVRLTLLCLIATTEKLLVILLGLDVSLQDNFCLLIVNVFSAYISTGQIMGWGNKAIEIRSAETGHLDGVFMHKKAQKLKFLCERNDKVITCLRFMSSSNVCHEFYDAR